MYIYPYNPSWKDQFLIEKNAIIGKIKCELTLYHIGSTAVRGLSAKNCIDMLGVLDDINKARHLSDPLKQLGYAFKGEYGEAGRAYFSKPKGPKCHLHVFQDGNSNIKKHLAYVQTMNANPRLVEEFNDVKNKLQARYPDDKNSYQQAKVYFYDQIFKF